MSTSKNNPYGSLSQRTSILAIPASHFMLNIETISPGSSQAQQIQPSTFYNVLFKDVERKHRPLQLL